MLLEKCVRAQMRNNFVTPNRLQVGASKNNPSSDNH